MASIDITTAQKITITYDLANLWERLAALLIDIGSLVAWMLIVLLTGSLLLPDFMNLLAWIFLYPVVVFYSLIFEMLNNGQSLGKMLLGLKVVKIDGNRPAPVDFLVRWAFRMVDIWASLGTVAFILISGSDKNQRLGDLLANTTVIKSRPRQGYSLQTLFRMQKREQYTPVYQNAGQMTETDMIMVKRLLDRLARYPNEGHMKALDLASEKIALKLSIPLEPYHPYFEENPIIRAQEREKRISFLQTLLKDYVILTR